MTVAQFKVGDRTCSEPRTDGAATSTAGISRASATASSSVTVRRLPCPGRVDAALPHDDQVRAKTLDLLNHSGLGAGADGHHRDDSADADDDAEHREDAPQH